MFPRSIPPTIIDDVRALNRRIKRELVRPRQHAGFDLKNGEGGIREIEFFVQALQLIHAGKQPSLRCRGTLVALDALQFAGLVTDAEHHLLAQAYRWARRAEHILQLDGGLQTQTLPHADHARGVFARRLGYAGPPAGLALAADLEKHTTGWPSCSRRSGPVIPMTTSPISRPCSAASWPRPMSARRSFASASRTSPRPAPSSRAPAAIRARRCRRPRPLARRGSARRCSPRSRPRRTPIRRCARSAI